MGTSAHSTPNRSRRFALGAAAVVTVGLASAYASVSGAQPTTDPLVLEIVSVDQAGGVQNLSVGDIPAISNSAAVVAYETQAATPNDQRVWIRDRVGGTSRGVAEVGSAAPGISGNGCVVAYPVIGDDDTSLTVVDRCTTSYAAALPIGTVLGSVSRVDDSTGAAKVSAPALSFDGSTIVWSTGREIQRYERPATGGPYGTPLVFDVAAGGLDEFVTGSRVDVSADGRAVVFVAGPGTTPFAPSPANVYAWTAPTTPAVAEPELLSATSSGGPAVSDSSSPTISDDGTFVAFESAAVDLAVVGSSAVVAPFVVGADLTIRTSQVILEGAARPALSADGNHIVYQRGDALRVLTSIDGSTVDVGIDELAAADPLGPAAISQFGRWLVFAGSVDLAAGALDPAPPGSTPVIWAADRSSSVGGAVDTTTSTSSTTTTSPPTSTTTPTTPTTSATPTTPAPTEVTIAPTIPAPTLPTDVIVPRFPSVGSFPSVSFPESTPRSPTSGSSYSGSSYSNSSYSGSSYSGSSYSGSSYSGSGTSIVSASASSVTFGPTVVDAGRRTDSVILSNTTADNLDVSAVTIDVTEAFAVLSDSCTGVSVAPGVSCAVEVQFAPISVGQTNGSVQFQLSDGSVVTASLVGEAVAGPTLDLVPAVAGAGQTVTVFGSAFPPGSTIELSQPGAAVATPVVVDGDGTFAHVVVVLPNTPSGPAGLSVAGQPDVFNDVVAELLVSNRGAASSDAAVRGGPSRPLGR